MGFNELFNLDNDHVNEITFEDLLRGEKNILPVLSPGEFIDFMDLGDVGENCTSDNFPLIECDDSMLEKYTGSVGNTVHSFSDMCEQYQNKSTSSKAVIKRPYNTYENSSRVRMDFGAERGNMPSINDINKIANKLIQASNYMNYCNMLYWFNGRIWSCLNMDQFRTHALECIDDENNESMSMRNIKELYDRIKCMPEIQQNQESVCPDPRYLCFSNGIYDLYQEILMPHSPNYSFFSFIKADYVLHPRCEGKVFEDFIGRASNGIVCIRERLLDVISYCMSDYSKAKAIPLLVGDKNSGKTTFANLISMIVGYDNCVSISLNDFDKWTTASLVGKKVCLSTDLPNIKLSKGITSILKQLSGGDLIKAEEKGKNPFSFYNSSKIVLASNYMPTLPENDRALQDRWVIVPFLHSLTEDEINNNLLSELEAELPYIINICTEQLKKLILNKFRFTDIGEYENCFETDGIYIDLDQDVIIKEFVETSCIIHPQSKTLVSELYQKYHDFCSSRYELSPLSAISFSKALRRLLPSSIKDGGHANGRSLIGIGLNNIRIDQPHI